MNRQRQSGNSSQGGEDYHPTSRECEQAIALAEAVLPTIGAKPPDYKLIVAINLRTRAGAYRGPQFWNLTFKRRDLIPATLKEELGAGGEIFVEVDLGQKLARLVGHGD